MNAFHCRIVCDNEIIDFMAPVFRESIQSAGVASNCPEKMFQKHIELMSQHYDSLNNSGDFYLKPNKKTPKKIDGTLTMRQ